MKKCSCGATILDDYIMCLHCSNSKKVFDKKTLWLHQFADGLQKNDKDSILALFDNSAAIYITPFAKCEKITDTWNHIANENIININNIILTHSDTECVVEFQFNYEKEVVNAVLHIKFDTDNKCTYLKQWSMTKQ